MACWVRGSHAWAFAFALLLPVGCDDGAAGEETGADTDDDMGSTGSMGATGSDATSTTTDPSGDPTTSPTTDPTDPTDPSGSPTTDPTTDPTDPTDPSGSESGGDEGPIPDDGWIEIGYGLDEFFPFEGELPVTLGPQGFMMFSLPLHGGNFPIPPDPFDFEHPDTPILSVWTDIEGIPGEHPSGHFAAYLNYPVPFTPSDLPDVQYEFLSVWLVIPETYTGAELAGREAVVHAEVATSDGQLLIDEHTLTVIDET